jgi:hypothetical protein
VTKIRSTRVDAACWLQLLLQVVSLALLLPAHLSPLLSHPSARKPLAHRLKWISLISSPAK